MREKRRKKYSRNELLRNTEIIIFFFFKRRRIFPTFFFSISTFKFCSLTSYSKCFGDVRHTFILFLNQMKNYFFLQKNLIKNGRTFWSHLSLITNAWQFFNECVMPPWCVYTTYTTVHTHTISTRESSQVCVCWPGKCAYSRSRRAFSCALLL